MIHKAYKVIELLGGDIEILANFGSWRDTIPDEDCMFWADQWIENKTKDKKVVKY